MDNILTCGSCGAKMRVKPTTLRIVKEVKCIKCQAAIKVPAEMREAANNGTLKAPPPTIRKSSVRRSVAPGTSSSKAASRKPALTRSPKVAKPAAESRRSSASATGSKTQMKESSPPPPKSVRRPVVITRKKQAEKKPASLDPPANTGKPMRPKTIVAPPPAAAPVTVAPASGGGADDGVSSSTVKLIPKSDVTTVESSAKPEGVISSPAASGARSSVRISAATVHPAKTLHPASPAQTVAQIAANGPASVRSASSGEPDLRQAVADIAELKSRLDALEGGGIEARLAALEKATVSLSTVHQEGAEDLADLLERFESLKSTVSKIDNRLACLLKINLEQAQHLAVDLTNI